MSTCIRVCVCVCVCVFQRDRCKSVSAGSAVGSEQEGSSCHALEEVQSIQGNKNCCDCGEPGPDWASINLGITLCITCSGIHRYTHTHMNTRTHPLTHSHVHEYTHTLTDTHRHAHTHTHTAVDLFSFKRS